MCQKPLFFFLSDKEETSLNPSEHTHTSRRVNVAHKTFCRCFYSKKQDIVYVVAFNRISTWKQEPKLKEGKRLSQTDVFL